MSKKRLGITEYDEAGNITATYVSSSTGKGGSDSRVDVILPEKTKSPWQKLLDVFLPAGYPHSVTDDYLEYQIYDSLQAFSSSIAGLLSSRAVLSSVGVGDSTASPTAALLLSVLQESAGRVATILFAHKFGTSLEPECKMYRLLADILNDIAFVLDCLSPAFPKVARVFILSFSSVLRALCGVAAGSAKASLSAHFARWGNLGELNAKDSSQETVISLLGMLAGSVVVSYITTPMATWTLLIVLLSIHLETNRRAVRAVVMRTLNRQRATLVYHHLATGHVPTPEEVSREERIFEQDGVLRDVDGRILGHCTVGASTSQLLGVFFPQNATTQSSQISTDSLSKILSLYNHKLYILSPSVTATNGLTHCNVIIKKGAASKDLIEAWWQALAAAKVNTAERTLLHDGGTRTPDQAFASLGKHMQRSAELLVKYAEQLTQAGWDLETGALETRSATRVAIAD